jgi:hypothetical protein
MWPELLFAQFALVRPVYARGVSVVGVVTDWVVLLLLVVLGVVFVRRWRRRYRAALAHRDQLVADSQAYAELRARLSASSVATGGQVVLNVGSLANGDGESVGSGADRCRVCGAFLHWSGRGCFAGREGLGADNVFPGLAERDLLRELGDVACSGGLDRGRSVVGQLREPDLEVEGGRVVLREPCSELGPVGSVGCRDGLGSDDIDRSR